MPSKKKPAAAPVAPATGKVKAKAAPTKPDTPKPAPAAQAKPAAKKATPPAAAKPAKPAPPAKAPAPADHEAVAKKVAGRVAAMFGAGERGLPGLELLGVLHGESLTGAEVATRYVVEAGNPMEPLRKHKLIEGDKARRFSPTDKGKAAWAWAVSQVGG